MYLILLFCVGVAFCRIRSRVYCDVLKRWIFLILPMVTIVWSHDCRYIQSMLMFHYVTKITTAVHYNRSTATGKLTCSISTRCPVFVSALHKPIAWCHILDWHSLQSGKSHFKIKINQWTEVLTLMDLQSHECEVSHSSSQYVMFKQVYDVIVHSFFVW